MSKHVAIIGGGFAGMAAAVELTRAGIPVTVFEAAKQLGGRARTVTVNGLELDNGQHILIGAYRETLRLIDLVHDVPRQPPPYMRLPLRLEVPDRFRLAAPRLPAPLHLAMAIIQAQGIPWRDRLSLIGFFSRLKKQQFRLPDDTTLLSWLSQQGQSRHLIKWLWEPLCLAALNTPPGIASAQLFVNVLRDSLMGQASDSDMVLPTRPLGELFPETAGRWLEQHGGRIHYRCRVNSISQTAAGGFQIDSNSNNGPAQFSHVICAASPARTGELLPAQPIFDPLRQSLQRLDYQPIYTVYLRYPYSIRLRAPMYALPPGRMVQWLFDRGRLTGEAGLLAAVISADGAHAELTHTQIAMQADEEIRAALMPGLPSPLWSQVIAEKRATFAAVPHLQRPANQTALAHLLLAGDYTASDYPATLEGAVRSGVQCAHLITSKLA